MQSKLAAVVATVAVLVLTWTPSARAQPPADPCGQVTAAQVSTALGETVGAGQKINAKTCTWIADKPVHQVVSVMLSPPGDWDRLKRPQEGVTKTSVSGVGEDAFAETLGNVTTLYGKKGNATSWCACTASVHRRSNSPSKRRSPGPSPQNSDGQLLEARARRSAHKAHGILDEPN
jgi:hypothetical protein